ATPTPAPATLTTSPNPVRVDAGHLGSTTVTWSTGRSEDGQVYVSESGQPEKLFAAGSSGSQEAPWIRAGASYEFHLYGGPGQTNRLGAISVTRAPDAPGHEAPPPERCHNQPEEEQ